MCGYAPWGAQGMVNGHEWVERQARARKVRGAKEGNGFIEGTHYQAVDRLASALNGPDLGPRLTALRARWLYSACLCFALPLAEQQRLDFHYHYSIWQLEYSRNYLFHQAQVLEEVFQKLIDRTRAPLDIKTLETLFGRRHRQPTKKQQRAGRRGYEVAQEVDASSWEVTVWRVRWGSVVLKVYDKAGRGVAGGSQGAQYGGARLRQGVGQVGRATGVRAGDAGAFSGQPASGARGVSGRGAV